MIPDFDRNKLAQEYPDAWRYLVQLEAVAKAAEKLIYQPRIYVAGSKKAELREALVALHGLERGNPPSAPPNV